MSRESDAPSTQSASATSGPSGASTSAERSDGNANQAALKQEGGARPSGLAAHPSRPLQSASPNTTQRQSQNSDSHDKTAQPSSSMTDPSSSTSRGRKRRLPSGSDEGNEGVRDNEGDGELGTGGPSQQRARRRGKWEDRRSATPLGDDGHRVRAASPLTELEDDEEEINGRNGSASAGPSISVNGPRSMAPIRRRDLDGYAAGEIVRVKLTNFVTYDFVQFSPGPHLNMIVGPNGTGKSTIVCAIALGLGYKPSVLGRAKDVSKYVKEGCSQGSIEIELKGNFPRQKNPIIQRLINAENDTSDWRLDGARSSAKEVISIVDGLGIEIGNLCCFLPQDKVADFAKMGPAELLRETQKAAGRAGMIGWHDQLIKLGNEQKEMLGKITTRDEELRSLMESVDYLSRDVQRAQERQQLERRVASLGVLLTKCSYEALKTRWTESKENLETAKKALSQLKDKLKPIRDRLDALQGGVTDLETQLKALRREAMRDSDNCNKCFKDLERIETDAEKLIEKLDAVKTREQSKRSAIAKLREDIRALEEATREEPPRPDTRRLDAEARTLREQERALADRDADAKTEQEEISNEMRGLARKTDGIRRRLLDIDNVKNARLQMLQRADVDTYKAIMWLRENANLFNQKVYEPVMLEISVRDLNMASAVEGCINFAGQKTFVCQTEEDYDLFGRLVVDRERLRVNYVHRQHARALHDFQSPAPREALEGYGFDGYVLDLLEGPEPVLRYLCADFHLESVPFVQDERRVDSNAVERSNLFKRYITGRNLHTLSRSQYGSRAIQTTTRTLRNARTFVQSADHAARRQLDGELQQINGRKRELESQGTQIEAESSTRRKQAQDLKQKRNAIEQQKGEMLKIYGMWEKDVVKLSGKKAALRDEVSRPSAIQESRKLVPQINQKNDQAQKLVVEINALLQNQIRLRMGADSKALQLLERQSKATALSNLKEREEGQFDEKQQTIEELAAETRECKAKAMEGLRAAKASIADASEEVRADFEALQAAQMSQTEVETRLNEEQAKLQMSLSVQPGVLAEYNRKRKQIRDLEDELSKIQHEKRKLDDRSTNIYKVWKPALDELIASVNERFSAAFAAIGTAGDVRLAVNDDYEQWGIEIYVKFRNDEPLQVLTAQRQSGGERSISTITYLLSLTQMSRSPFSLVDEINQGMDQKYERQVHDHMVRVTCAEMAGQYFLITPKLLPDLTYHERMRVLIINNGEWLPEKFDFWHYIRAKQARGGQALPQQRRVRELGAAA